MRTPKRGSQKVSGKKRRRVPFAKMRCADVGVAVLVLETGQFISVKAFSAIHQQFLDQYKFVGLPSEVDLE